MMKKAALFVLLLLVMPTIIYAQDYYAELGIVVDSSGFATISGQTNHPDLLAENTQQYTSKSQELWLLNITREEVFSDYVFSVQLPKYASINYVKSAGSFRIEQEGGSLVIRGSGQEKPFSILVQYSIKKQPAPNSLFFLVILFFVVFWIVVLFLVKGKKINIPYKKTKFENKSYNSDSLTARQKQIVELLASESKPLTQAYMQRKLKIPKASISRNIRSLELKGTIVKEKAGMTAVIRLKQE